jgi:hypothetical protein
MYESHAAQLIVSAGWAWNICGLLCIEGRSTEWLTAGRDFREMGRRDSV